MPNPAIPLLLAARSGDGGWGPYPGAASRTEATALAILALNGAAEPAAEAAAERSLEWLTARQLDSGAWPLADAIPGPSWSTSLATLAVARLRPGSPAALAGGRWLLDQEGRGHPLWFRILSRFFRRRDAVRLDAELEGWPWSPDTFSWVEPTSYAVLALASLRADLEDDRLPGRIAEAHRLLADRECEGGGWNYGNSRVLGEELWPYPDTTAVALLALAGSSDSAVERGLDALGEMLPDYGSLLALGLAATALAVHGRDAGPVRDRLAARLDTRDGGEIRALAWAALGLSEHPDALGVRNA